MKNSNWQWIPPAERAAYYGQQLLGQVPQLLTAIDKSQVGATSGCLDREYWGWATKDFVNMDLQRGLLVLAHVYRTPFNENHYYADKALRAWIESGLRFWCNRQDRCGAFDHLYAHERSWMAAAFTGLDCLKTVSLMGDDLSANIRRQCRESFLLASSYLIRYDEVHGFISNHRAAAAAFLMGVAAIYDDQFKKGAYDLLDGILAKQSPEGWYCEYQGPDPGYQTLGLHYLSHLYQYIENPGSLLESVERSLVFLATCVHPDGSIGGAYGSRACPHFFPGGFEVFAPKFPLSSWIAGVGCRAVREGASPGLADADVRNAIPIASSFVLAHETAVSAPSKQPEGPELPAWWEQGGICIHDNYRYYAVVGLKKGGCLLVYDKGQRKWAYTCTGYSATCHGLPVATNIWNDDSEYSFTDESDDGISVRVDVKTSFHAYSPDRTMHSWPALLFRFFNLTAGRINLLNRLARRIIIHSFLTKKKAVDCYLKRRIVFESDHIHIEDEMGGPAKSAIRNLCRHGFISTVYMASTQYFREMDRHMHWSEKIDHNAGIIRTLVDLESNEK